MKKWLALSGLSIIFAFIAWLFWLNEWRYSLPTPLPANYMQVSKGTYINLNQEPAFAGKGPVFLHFFNPDCPCSRFNINHFKELVNKYGSDVNFAIVVMTKNKNYTATYIKEKFGLDVKVLSDTSLAGKCGVYSTPQAVLLDGDHRLYYRGNYNRSRYCTNSKTSYARMAIDSLLNSAASPFFDKYALTAYGCSLPNCKK